MPLCSLGENQFIQSVSSSCLSLKGLCAQRYSFICTELYKIVKDNVNKDETFKGIKHHTIETSQEAPRRTVDLGLSVLYHKMVLS